ncbi:MAG TPA: Hsp20/alpha crystallin family protein [Candidatus Angelobacter sp.]|nr:Hsp20/alpha crystallin family protein [Candidatus Angelobacter sp.]
MNLLRWQRPELASWPTFGGLSTLRNEIDRLFEAPLSELAHGSHFLSGSAPALDVFEDKDNFVVKAELPGMKKEDIDVSLHDGTLSISGERKSDKKWEDAEVYRAERFFGRFQRTVALPSAVDAAKIKAQYKDGVLTITLPKAEEAKPKQIDVQVS